MDTVDPDKFWFDFSSCHRFSPSFFLLTVPDSNNFERKYKFLETRIYWDTLLHIVLVFSFVSNSRMPDLTSWLKVNTVLTKLQLILFFKWRGGSPCPILLSPMISPFANGKIDNWLCKAYHGKLIIDGVKLIMFYCHVQFSFFLVSCL